MSSKLKRPAGHETKRGRSILAPALTVTCALLGFASPGIAGPSGACVDPGDLSLINSSAFDGQPEACSVGCVGPQFVSCCTDCLVTEVGLSTACATCYAAEQECTIDNCAAPCISDPVSCQQCREANGCTSAFETCSGLVIFRDGFESGDTFAWSDTAP